MEKQIKNFGVSFKNDVKWMRKKKLRSIGCLIHKYGKSDKDNCYR